MTITINTSDKTIKIQGEIRLNELVSFVNAFNTFEEYEVTLDTHKVTAYEVTYVPPAQPDVHPTEVPPSWCKAGTGGAR